MMKSLKAGDQLIASANESGTVIHCANGLFFLPKHLEKPLLKFLASIAEQDLFRTSKKKKFKVQSECLKVQMLKD